MATSDGPPLPNGTATPPDTNQGFADLVLEDLGDIPSAIDVNNILQWMEHENSPSTWTGTAGANNPLNNGLGSGGGAGLGSYPDLTTAAQEVAGELSGAKGSGLTGGAAVISDLKSNAPTAQFATDIENTNWAGGHYGHAAWGGGPIGVTTAAQSAAAGASGPVKVGPGTVAISSGSGSAPGPDDPAGSSGGSGGSGGSAKQPTAALAGPGAVLEELDNWLNPSGGSLLTQLSTLGASDVISTVQLLVARGMFFIVFAGIGYLGLKTFLAKSSGSFTDTIENQQREARLRGQADTLAQGEQRRSALLNAGEGTGAHSIGANAGKAGEGAGAAEGIGASIAEAAPEALVLL
jgi:hypothetical protein